jgi:hypothetical protein
MAQQTLTNGEGGLSFRTKINDNFTEVYDSLATKIDSDTTNVASASAVSNIITLSQEAYDAIVTPDTSTLYIIS